MQYPPPSVFGLVGGGDQLVVTKGVFVISGPSMPESLHIVKGGGSKTKDISMKNIGIKVLITTGVGGGESETGKFMKQKSPNHNQITPHFPTSLTAFLRALVSGFCSTHSVVVFFRPKSA